MTARTIALGKSSFRKSGDALGVKANQQVCPTFSEITFRKRSSRVSLWSLVVGIVRLTANAGASSAAGVWDVTAHGAKGDGATLDTAAIQAAIDACHAAGGGRVYLHNGRFLSGTLYLKSHVTLEVEAGATLLGSPDEKDYPRTPSTYPGYDGEMRTGKALIYAEGATNIALIGRGTIDGQGERFNTTEKGAGAGVRGPSFNVRPRLVHFVRCENIRVSGLTMRNSASWVQCYEACRDLVIDGISVNSTVGHNKDGLDLVDCSQVRVSNCFIVSGDDAICLKSLDPDSGCRDITISNCVLSSRCYAFKIGTETAGVFENIVVQNCSIYDSREGIGIQTVDGARVENIVISNLALRNIRAAAIAIRHGARDRPYRRGAAINRSVLRNLIISNVQGTGIGKVGSSIVGLAERPVENVVLRDIRLTSVGGGTSEDATREIPELPRTYPKSEMFGTLPAHGFFVRHARGVRFTDVRFELLENDARPAIVAVGAHDLEITGLKISPRMTSPQAVVTERQPRPGEAAPADWQPLFNGTNLSGWKVQCKPEDQSKNCWRVEDGCIVADSMVDSKHDYIWLQTDREFGDFELRLKFQAFRDSPGNSGVQFRSRYDEAAGWLDGPQLDIHPPGPWRTGFIYDETRGVQKWIAPSLPKVSDAKPEMAPPNLVMYYSDDTPAWNELEISARGTRVRAVLNRVVVRDWDGAGVLDDAKHRERDVGVRGHLALQIHKGDRLKMRFKDVSLRELDNTNAVSGNKSTLP